MRELSMNEVEQVSGGAWLNPFTVGVLSYGATVFADAVFLAWTGKDASEHLAPALTPVDPYDAYYGGRMYISP